MIENALTIWNAGFETVGHNLTFALYQLTLNPTISARLLANLESIWPNPLDPPPLSSLEKLPYLTAILKESLRLGSGVLTRLGRVNPTSTEHYKSSSLPAGTTISMSLPLIHRDPSIFPEPLTFDPERWLGGAGPNATGPLDKYLVAFSRGSRACIGENLAWIEMRMILATIVRRFEFEIVEGLGEEDIAPYFDDFVSVPKRGRQMLLVRARARVAEVA